MSITTKRKVRTALILIFCGVLLLDISASCSWMCVFIGDGLGVQLKHNISGKQWSTALFPISLIIVFGAIMWIFIRGMLAYVISYVIALLGFIACISPITVLGSSEGDFLRYLISRQLVSDRYTIEFVRAQWGTVFMALLGGFLIIGGALYSLKYPLSGDNSRYGTSAVRERKLHEQILAHYHKQQEDGEICSEDIVKKYAYHQALWKAQDQGIDLTDGDQ